MWRNPGGFEDDPCSQGTCLEGELACMIGSSVGIAAAAHLGSLADILDLDGNLLVTNDPYEVLRLENGNLFLSDLPGLGIVTIDR